MKGGSRVTLVRENGYTDRVKAKVVRELDLSTESQVDCWDDPEEWEESRKLQIQVADEQAAGRGRAAKEKLAADSWMQKRIDKAEEELRKSVQLVEKLRSANLVRQHKEKVQVIDVDPAAPDTAVKVSASSLAKSAVRPTKSILRDSQNLPKLPVCPDLQQQQPVKQQQRRRIVWKQPEQAAPKIKSNHKKDAIKSGKSKIEKSANGTNIENAGKVDSSRLSTILEATENTGDSTTASSLPDDEVDFIPVRGPSAADDRSSSFENIPSSVARTKNISANQVNTISARESHPSTFDRLTSKRLTSDRLTSNGLTSDRSDRLTSDLRPSLFVPLSSRTSFLADSGHHSSGAPTPTLTSDHLLFPSDGRSSDSFDLESIAIVIDRIKAHRRLMEEDEKENARPDTHFKVVEGAGQGTKSKFINNNSNSSNGSNNSKGAKFQLDKDFIRKVLEFESSSPLLISSKSDGSEQSLRNSSSGQPVKERKRTKKKTRQTTRPNVPESRPDVSESSVSEVGTPVHVSKPPKIHQQEHRKIRQQDSEEIRDNLPDLSKIADIPKPENERENKQLRSYIEKLLTMKHEEIENLSVSTVQSTSESFPLHSSLKSPNSLHSSLKSPNSLSSSSDSGKKVRFELAAGVDRVDKPDTVGGSDETENSLDQTRYKPLQLKLNRNSYREEESLQLSQRQTGQPTDDRSVSVNVRAATSTVRSHMQLSRSIDDLDTSVLSYQEIQQIFREKRRELDVQLANLEDQGHQHMQLSEGSLSTSKGTSSPGSKETSQSFSEEPKTAARSFSDHFKAPRLQSKFLVSSSSSSLTNVTSIQTGSRSYSFGSRSTLSDIDSEIPKLLKKVTQSTPHQIQKESMSLHREQKTRQFSRREILQSPEEEMREISSFFSDFGSDSGSGSKLSRIDLSSDVSNLN